MPHVRLLMLVVLASSCIPGAALAQPGRAAFHPAWLDREIDRARHEPIERDGALVVRSDAYEARFTRAAAMVAPRTPGAAAWTYAALALERGSHRVTLPMVDPVATENRIDYRRAGLLERYVARRGGVEQIFVLETLPPGTGDVEVVGAVSGVRLEAVGADGLRFVDAGGAAIQYGRPVAFDAAGTPVPVRVLASDGELRLRLDGAAVARALLPVTIDPIIRPGASLGVAGIAPAVAFNPTRQEFLVAYDAADGIHVRRFRAEGVALPESGPAVSGVGELPTLAYNPRVRRYLLAWQTSEVDPVTMEVQLNLHVQLLDDLGTPVGGEIVREDSSGPVAVALDPPLPALAAAGRAFTVSGGSFSADVTLTPALVAEEPLPLVQAMAYDPASGARLGVAPAPGSGGIYAIARVVGPDLLSVYDDLFIDLDGEVTAESFPSIAFDPGTRRFLVAWVESRGDGHRHIYGAFLRVTTAPVAISKVGDSFPIYLNAGGTLPAGRPLVVAEPGGFVVYFERSGAAGDDNDRDIEARFVSPAGSVSSIGLGTLYSDVGTAPINDDLWIAAARGSYYGYMLGTWFGIPVDLRYGTFFGRFSHAIHSGSAVDAAQPRAVRVFRPSNGAWYSRLPNGTTSAITWGQAGDVPALMRVSPALAGPAPTVWRPSNGTWYSNPSPGPPVAFAWGQAGDIPVPGNYVGALSAAGGCDEFAVFRPSTSTWYIRDACTGAVAVRQWGAYGDVPVPADYDNDGLLELGVWRPSNGTWYTVELDGSGIEAVPFGQAGDVPLPGNFVGDDRADRVVWRPSNGVWYRRATGTNAVTQVQWGTVGDMPMGAKWDAAADPRLDMAVWRTNTGAWFIRDSDGVLPPSQFLFGAPADVPAAK